MKFVGVKRTIPVNQDYGQIDIIGQFWNEMRALFPDDFLFGLGTNWTEKEFDYYLGKIDEDWHGGSEVIELPDDNWHKFSCKEDDQAIAQMYKGIYERGPLDYEIESIKDGIFTTKVHYKNSEGRTS